MRMSRISSSSLGLIRFLALELRFAGDILTGKSHGCEVLAMLVTNPAEAGARPPPSALALGYPIKLVGSLGKERQICWCTDRCQEVSGSRQLECSGQVRLRFRLPYVFSLRI